MTEFFLVGVVGDIENSEMSNSVILEVNSRDRCIDFFKAMSEEEKQAFVEIFVIEKEKFTVLVDK